MMNGVIQELFNNSKFQRVKFDSIKLEQKLKKAYANEYNATLTQLNDMQPVEEQLQDRFDLQAYKVYDVGTDFNILMTSIAPYNSNFPKNYCEDWNRKENISQGFCCSYIRNDMLGHAPVPHVCYGFSNMDAKSLIISSVDDMGSNMSNGLVEKVAYDNVRFYSPNHQINAVYDESGYGFNEMVYSRMQNGKKKQPDYTIAFMKNGNIPNIDTIKQVVEQFKEQGIDLPIVIIDEDRCIQSEKMTLDSMIQDFEENPNQESYDKIQQRVKNNCVANNFEFQEYMNFILNSYEHMTEIMKRRTSQEAEEQISGWMEKCKSWYEYPKHLQGKVKDDFLGIKKNIVQFIKSRLTEKQKNKGNSIKEEERDK